MNRTEFRNTIGTEVEKRNQAIIQEKLKECINSGGMNSFDRLSNLFAGKRVDESNKMNEDEDAVVKNTGSTFGKDTSKVPMKKSSSKKHSMTGMYGDKTSKKMGDKRFKLGRTAISRGRRGGGGQKNEKQQ